MPPTNADITAAIERRLGHAQCFKPAVAEPQAAGSLQAWLAQPRS